MAGVPAYESFRTAPRGQGGFPIAVPSTEGFDEPFRQVKQAAQVAGDVGNTLGTIAIKEQEQANATRVMEASNAAREEALRLAYDPEEGYTNVRGGDVLPRDGKPLAVDYTTKFDERVGKIGANLANDAQRAAFAAEASRLRGSFEAGALEHESKEWNGYELSVADGSRMLAIEEIAKAKNNPAAIDTALGSLDTAVYQLGKLKGLAAVEIEAMQGANRSNAIKQSIASALAEDDVTTAEGLFDRYGDKLTEVDEIAVKGTLQKEVEGRLVMAAADLAEGLGPVVEGAPGGGVTSKGGSPIANARDVAQQLIPGIRVTSWRRPQNGVGSATSWHKQSGGAIDAAPVPGMTFDQFVGTFRKAGYAIIEALDEVNHPSKHSTGPHWHVVLGKPGTRGGSANPQANARRNVRAASLDEMWATAREHILAIRPDASPDVLKNARSEVEARWSMRERSKSAAEDNALGSAYAALAQNGGQVTPAIRRSVPPEKLPALYEFSRSMQNAGDREESDHETYLQVSDPAKLAAMTDAQLLALKPKLTDTDWKQAARDRDNVRLAGAKGAAEAAKQAGSIPRGGFNQVLGNRIAALGLSASPKADDPELAHVVAIKAFTTRAVLGEQAKLGRQMTEGELGQFVDQLFITNSVKVSNWRGSREVPAMSIGTGQLSGPDRKRIVDWFAANGVPNPTEADILSRLYTIRWEQSRGR